jgi:hypothetical protein
LKDAIQHHIPARIQSEAIWVIDLMNAYEANLDHPEFVVADDASLYDYLFGMTLEMEKALSKESLPIHDYHRLKKMSRELGILFLYLSQDAECHDYLAYCKAADLFFQINDAMAKVHDFYVSKEMHGELEEDQDVPLSMAIVQRLNFVCRKV